MIRLDVPKEWHHDIMNYLVENDLLNEKRYAYSYTIGKLRNNQWGRQKIYAGLRQKKLSNPIINEAFSSVDEDEYFSVLQQVMNRKLEHIGDISIDKNKKKLLNYALQKGFESSLIWTVINEIETNNRYGN
jgi:regulatory protein